MTTLMRLLSQWFGLHIEPLSDDDDREEASRRERELWERTRRLERMAIEADVIRRDDRPEGSVL